MKKLIITALIIFPLVIGCNGSDGSSAGGSSGYSEAQASFMEICTIADDSPISVRFCECCYSQFEKYGETPEYVDAIIDNCMSIKE